MNMEMNKEKHKVNKPWGATDWEGGGSQTWVTPAFARSGMVVLRELYHPPALLHDSQLKPCYIMKILKQIRFQVQCSQHFYVCTCV